MSNLKPCPFCGGSVQLNCNVNSVGDVYIRNLDTGERERAVIPHWFVSRHVSGCGCTVRIPNWKGKEQDSIIKIWNMRIEEKHNEQFDEKRFAGGGILKQH